MQKPKLIIFLIFLFAFSFLLFTSSYAQVPHLINYQGKLTDTNGNPVSDGTHSMTFRIYDAETGPGTMTPWEETQSVLVQKGIFSCLLGGVTNLDLPFDKPYWLAIKVGADEEMTPRQQISSSGYAFRAEEVDSLPRGIITMWSGSINSIPEGWAICDGSNSTPDLRDRFIVSVGPSYSPGATGGENAHVLRVNEMPAHNHTYNDPRDLDYGGGAGGDGLWGINNTASTGGGAAHENRPPYYALAYIMRL